MKKCGCSDSTQDPVDSFLENALTHFQSRSGGKSAAELGRYALDQAIK